MGLSNLFNDGEPSDSLYEIGDSVELRYNPRKNPFWVHSATNSNADGETFRHLFTSGNKVYVKERWLWQHRWWMMPFMELLTNAEGNVRNAVKVSGMIWTLRAIYFALIVDTKNLLRIDNMDELKLRIETEEYIYEEWIIENS